MGYPTLMGSCGCGDPGAKATGAHLSILDYQFCPYRLQNGNGFLVNQQTGSGFQMGWSTSPVPNLDTFQTVEDQNFGNIVAILANGQMRQLLGPATADLVPMTDAAGGVAFRALPTATIPDPLSLTTLNVTNLTAGTFTLTGTMSAGGIPTGTIANQLGLDGSGNVVKGGSTSGVGVAQFFESPTSPNAGTPNANVIPGNPLVIGNLLYSFGGTFASVTNSQTITVQTTGPYELDWNGQVDGLATAARVGAGIQLVVNGNVVNNGGCTPTTSAGSQNIMTTVAGVWAMGLTAGDQIQLRLAPSATGTTINVYEVGLRLTKIG